MNGYVMHDQRFEQMLISAERYACGRRTYIVADTVQYIASLLPMLSDWCIGVMLEDMRSQTEYASRVEDSAFGDPCDQKYWSVFKAKLLSEHLKRAEDGDAG